MASQLTHFAINTDDVDATQQFYGSVFGWTFRDYGPDFVQILADGGDRPIGAIQQRRRLLESDDTRGFECTFNIDDIQATREQVLAAGGRILMEPSTIEGVGQVMAFQDPGGNPLLAMQYLDR